jgi:protein-S-isoprenylcysteine O-methyltransferase Ste14
MAAPNQFWVRWRVRLGYPVALISLWLARPTPVSILCGAAIAALGLAIRGAAAGHLRKDEGLATSGIYACTRNPLYLGSAILAAGFAVAAHSWLVAAVVAAYFIPFYVAVIKGEEIELRVRYGKPFDEYAARVPLFLPRFRRTNDAGALQAPFSWQLYKRNREYQALLGCLAGIGLLWLRMLVAMKIE